MRKSKVIVCTVAFIILILFILLSFMLLTDRLRQKVPAASSGYVDLSEFDFDEMLAYIPHSSFLYYQSNLYLPKDFEDETIRTEAFDLKGYKGRFNPGDYGTYRIILKLPTDRTYGLSSYSAMYSQRLFINGTEYLSIGEPGKTADTTAAKTQHYTVYFTPEEEQTEIIIQFANFNHYDYGGIVPVYIGAQDKIADRDAIAQLRIHLFIGCIITAFLFFFGMFFFFPRRYSFLWFSLNCLTIGIRMLIINEKVIMLLFPNLSWRISISLEYLSLIILLFTFLLYIHSMFQGTLHVVMIWLYGVFCALYALTILLTPPIIFTKYMLGFQLITMLVGIYVIVALISNVIRKLENRRPEHVLILIGAFIFIVLSVVNIQLHRSGGNSLTLGLSEIGMIVLIFANMIALVLQFSSTEIELSKALLVEQEMQKTNQILDMMSRLKSDFLANISHEMRTPLTIMSSYAGLTSIQIQRNAIDDKTLDNLATIKREATRLANLVEQLKLVSLEKERQLILEDVKAIDLLQQIVEFCKPICIKNKNQLSISVNPKEILLRVNKESIFQTMINLIINANRHTKGGTIYLRVVDDDFNSEFVNLTVRDTGDGIDPKLMTDLFQRGVSGDNSSGLGLSICKEIIEEHGGKIWIESEIGKGTVVFLTLPCVRGEAAYEKC